MPLRLRTGLAFVLSLLAAPVLFGCTVFFAFDGKLALAGDNEDWHHPYTQIWFVPPSAGEHGTIYLGYGKGVYPDGGIATPDVKLPDGDILKLKTEDIYGFPQAGVNELGLFFGGSATFESHTPAPTGKKQFRGHFLHHLLRHCATVEEVVATLTEHDASFTQGNLLFGDRTGDSLILEATGKTYRKRGSQVITNFWQSTVTPDKVSCDRFRRVTQRLAQEKEVSLDLARSLLKETSAKSTLYSTVYDLTNGQIHLYYCGQFEKVVTLDIKKELARGPRAVTLASLFGE